MKDFEEFMKIEFPIAESEGLINTTEKAAGKGLMNHYNTNQNNQLVSDIEKVASRLEASRTDITSNYNDWIKIGFAFAHALGEEGREYFHRVSRFYPRYCVKECDNQYDNCLKTNTARTNIDSFFYLAKEAGIDIHGEYLPFSMPFPGDLAQLPAGDAPLTETVETPLPDHLPLYNTPLLQDDVYRNIPDILRECCDLFTDGIEKDVFLMSAITVLSACLPNIEGVYFGEPHSPHLYLFITARAGSGKGKMKWAKYLGGAIHEQKFEQWRKEYEVYENEAEKYDCLSNVQKQGVEKPKEPGRKMLFIPANSSTAAFIRTLAHNNFRGIIFETEADTMVNTARQEWGDTSDVFRKAFHHEATSLNRRKDNEYLEINNPHLAIVLSGTPKQVKRLMPEVENGLFSRFMYYAFEDDGGFKNPFQSHHSINLPGFFANKGFTILNLHEQLQERIHPILFQLTEAQGTRFTQLFNTMLTKDKLLLGSDFDANVKRLGLITFRIAMILSALRILENGDISSPMICSDQDYETAISIATTLEKHAIAVFQHMPNNGLQGKKLAFYDKLPQQFNRQGYLKAAAQLDIKAKTAEHYIDLFKVKLLKHEHNEYSKI